MIGGIIMVHSDDYGLVLPPNIAPTKVSIISIKETEKVIEEKEVKQKKTYINPLKENHIEVYVYGKDYVFSSVEEVFNTPFLNGKKIPEVLNEITWEKRI